MVNIRPVDPEKDSKAIADIYNHYILNSTATFDVDPVTTAEMQRRAAEISTTFPWLVAEDEGRILGFCFAHTWKLRAAYSQTLESTVYLRPDCCGRGMGRALMSALIDRCRQSGVRSLIACITAENTASCRFHESLGYKEASHFKEVGCKFGRLLDVKDYQLSLSEIGSSGR